MGDGGCSVGGSGGLRHPELIEASVIPASRVGLRKIWPKPDERIDHPSESRARSTQSGKRNVQSPPLPQPIPLPNLHTFRPSLCQSCNLPIC